LGDELDGPRGRIYLIKDMLENNKPANEKIVKHIDRCLSCYSCMTTCPSGVNYMHLIDHGRKHIEKTFKKEFDKKFLLSRILQKLICNQFFCNQVVRALKGDRDLAETLVGVIGDLKPAETVVSSRFLLKLVAAYSKGVYMS